MLLHGDCLEQLKTLEPNSVDSLVTDPPAGISFMGKDWDGDKGGRDGWITWMADVMRECNRVLKPGAHAFVWAIPRTSHWTATALEDAGFEIRDVVTHLFGQGFPKSLDISKAMDKAAGAEREILYVDHKIARKDGRAGESLGKQQGQSGEITAPATDLAKEWQGWGTALKPASEHWILCRKPISEKTVAKNVEKWGTGGINIDGCRIEGAPPSVPQPSFNSPTGKTYGMKTGEGRNGTMSKAAGRFPANLVLSHTPHCDDETCDIECAIKALDEQSGISKSTAQARHNKPSENLAMSGANLGHVSTGHADSGGASRFFYCAKISKSERNEGLEDLPDQIKRTHMRGSNGTGKKNFEGGFNDTIAKNTHPTVKPQKLMRYLCRMITPPGGVVLDPFMGSGSTGLAAIKEGFKFIGIERELDYFAIAEKRMEAV